MYQTIQIKVLGIIHCYKYISYGHECAPAKKNSHVIIINVTHTKSSGKLYALYLPWNSIHTSRYTVPIKKAEVSTVVVRK